MNAKQYKDCEMLGIVSCDWFSDSSNIRLPREFNEQLTDGHIKTFQTERSNTTTHLYSELYLQIAMFNFEEYEME
jgi:hypothetical protein